MSGPITKRREGADPMLGLVIDERYRTYEDLAARDGSRFVPNWEDV